MPTYAKGDLTAASDTLLYTNATTLKTVTCMLTNRSANPAKVSMAVVANGDTLSLADWVEYRTKLGGNQPLERGPFHLDVGDRIYVRSETAGVSAKLTGVSR